MKPRSSAGCAPARPGGRRYKFLEGVLGAQEYARLRELVVDGVDEIGYGDGGDARLDEIVDHLLAEAK